LRRQPVPAVELTETIASHEADAGEALIRQEEENCLTRALEGLEPRDRLIIRLFYQQSLSPEEIASILKVSVGTFYTQKSRAVAKLRDSLCHVGENPPVGRG
jgi:RNA polymerase sigma factor (sigma-70 family)